MRLGDRGGGDAFRTWTRAMHQEMLLVPGKAWVRTLVISHTRRRDIWFRAAFSASVRPKLYTAL